MALARTISTVATLSGGPKHLCIEPGGAFAYVTSAVTGRISQLNTSTMTFVANWFGTGTAGVTNGVNGTGQVSGPTCPCTDGTNTYWIETANNKIRMAGNISRTISDFAGSGVAGTADGTGTAATFQSLSGMVMNNAGTKLYVSHGVLIRVIDVATGVVTTLAGSAPIPAITQAGTFLGITADDKYLIGSYSSRLWVLELANPGYLSYIAGNGVTTADADGLSRLSQFRDTSQFAASPGLIFIAENTGKSLRQLTFDPQALVPNMTNVAGDGTAFTTNGTATGTGTGTAINGCGGVVVWPGQGTLTLLCTDINGGVIRKIV